MSWRNIPKLFSYGGQLQRALSNGDAIIAAESQSPNPTKGNTVLISSKGGIASLMQICRSWTPSAVAAVAGVLKNLAAVQELRQSFLDENAVPALIRVLKYGTAMAQENFVGCLCNLAAEEENQSVKIAILKKGCWIACWIIWRRLVRMLEVKGTEEKEAAVKALAMLFSS